MKIEIEHVSMGDIVNVLMADAANNFKRAMRALCCMLQKI